MKHFAIIVCSFLFTTVFFSSCKEDISDNIPNEYAKVADYDYTVLHQWNDLWLQLDRVAPGFRPCPSANALGYVGIANYESVVFGMPEYRSLEVFYGGLNLPKPFFNQEYHWPTVLNAVNNYLYSRIFAEVNADIYKKINALYQTNENNYKQSVTEEVFVRSRNRGVAVAEAVWTWMNTDKVAVEAQKNPFEGNNWQNLINQPGAWTPTAPGPGEGYYPTWGKTRRLALPEDLVLCASYKNYTGKWGENETDNIYAQANEINSFSGEKTPYEFKWIGEFWCDEFENITFSTASRWLAMADQVYVNENVTLEQAVLANAKIGIAMHDAAIGAWNSKYHYNIQRPETYIINNINPSFKTGLVHPIEGYSLTPSYPSYPSAHATFGGAAAEVLASVFGYNYSMTDNCHKNRGEFLGYPRNFNNFYEMAVDCANSRFLLGVNYRMDAEEGVKYGTRIGQAVNKLPWKK